MLTEDQVRIEELEESVTQLTETLTDLMDFIYDSCQLQRPDSNDAAELYKIIKKHQGE